jgi:hypothetical protein
MAAANSGAAGLTQALIYRSSLMSLYILALCVRAGRLLSSEELLPFHVPYARHGGDAATPRKREEVRR